jgi:hypothetical protein
MTVAPEVGADHLTMLDGSPPDLVSVAREAEVVVNATPLGMKGGDPLPLAAEHVDEGRAVCDAVYRPAGRPRWSEKPAREASGSSPARGCSCTRAYWHSGSGPDGGRT